MAKEIAPNTSFKLANCAAGIPVKSTVFTPDGVAEAISVHWNDRASKLIATRFVPEEKFTAAPPLLLATMVVRVSVLAAEYVETLVSHSPVGTPNASTPST